MALQQASTRTLGTAQSTATAHRPDNDDSSASSIFLSSDDTTILGTHKEDCNQSGLADLDDLSHGFATHAAGPLHPDPVNSTALSDLPGNSARSQQHAAANSSGRSHPARPPGPVLWRLFPRCIRAATEEVCIAAEVTLNVAPSDCQITVVKDGARLPVRMEFLNDRQATGDDTDQPSRSGHGRGSSRAAMQAIAAWQRRAAGSDGANHDLRSSRPDSELVLIWVTPGASPGLMLIELHLTQAASHTGSDHSFSSNFAAAAASTGMLESHWRTYGAAAAAAAASAAAPPAPPTRGFEVVPVAGTAAWPQGAPSARSNASTRVLGAAASIGAIDRSSSPPLMLGATGDAPAAALIASLHNVRMFGLSAPDPMRPPRRDARSWGGEAGERRGPMFSSGALTVVAVPDAGIEAEVGALLAMQHQQMPLPVTGGGGPAAVLGQDPPAPPPPPHQQQSAYSAAAGHSGLAPAWVLGGAEAAAAATAGPSQAPPLAEGVGGDGDVVVAVDGLLAEGVEDKEDARARERFLWDLGAWLEMSVRITREATGRAAAAAAQLEPGQAALHRILSLQDRELDQAHHHQPWQQQQRSFRRAMGGDLQPLSEIEPRDSGAASSSRFNDGGAPSSSRRVLYDLRPEIEPLGESLYGAAADPWVGRAASSSSRAPEAVTTEAWVLPGQAGEAMSAAHLMPRPALELLGFACSRGWASTSTHIVLGLMDMGFSMRAINAAVQGAHGWSALHLAVASGSVELVAMTALWRSYGRYDNVAAVQEEWRAMLASPGPGGLTPLHLAAVLPQPAAAAMDLLSTLPAETLTTWFGEAACDSCTPAHYAHRAGNSHLNDHALLCLATGTAALDLGMAQGLQEVLPYLSEVQADLADPTRSESADFQEGPSSGGGDAVATASRATGTVLVSLGVPSATLASASADPSSASDSAFESASEGSLGPISAQAEAATVGHPAHTVHCLMLPPEFADFGGGGGGNDTPRSISSVSRSCGFIARDIGGHAPSPPQPQTAATSRPRSAKTDSQGNLASADSMRNGSGASRGTAGGLRSAIRAAAARLGGAAARGGGAAARGGGAAAVGAACSSSSSSSSASSHRSFLSRLVMGRFQCLGGGGDGDGGNGISDDGGAARGPRPLLEFSSAGASAAASGDGAAGLSDLAQGRTREGPGSKAGSVVGAAATARAFASGQSGSSSPVAPGYGQWHQAEAPPPPTPQQPAADNGDVNAALLHHTSLPHTPTEQYNQQPGQFGSASSNSAYVAGIARILAADPPDRAQPARASPDGGLGSSGAGGLRAGLASYLARVAASGGPQTPGPRPPTHGSPADGAVWSPGPWPLQRRGWHEPGSIVADLLNRVSPSASTCNSAAVSSPPWGSIYSLGTSSASKTQRALVAGSAASAVAADRSSPSGVLSLQQARQAAMQIAVVTAAAAAVGNRGTVSAPERPMTLPREGGAAAAAAAAAGRSLMWSAPSALGDRMLTEVQGSRLGSELHQQLQRQAAQHRERVRAQLVHVMQRMRPGCPSLVPLLQLQRQLQQQQRLREQPQRYSDMHLQNGQLSQPQAQVADAAAAAQAPVGSQNELPAASTPTQQQQRLVLLQQRLQQRRHSHLPAAAALTFIDLYRQSQEHVSSPPRSAEAVVQQQSPLPSKPQQRPAARGTRMPLSLAVEGAVAAAAKTEAAPLAAEAGV